MKKPSYTHYLNNEPCCCVLEQLTELAQRLKNLETQQEAMHKPSVSTTFVNIPAHAFRSLDDDRATLDIPDEFAHKLCRYTLFQKKKNAEGMNHYASTAVGRLRHFSFTLSPTEGEYATGGDFIMMIEVIPEGVHTDSVEWEYNPANRVLARRATEIQ